MFSRVRSMPQPAITVAVSKRSSESLLHNRGLTFIFVSSDESAEKQVCGSNACRQLPLWTAAERRLSRLCGRLSHRDPGLRAQGSFCLVLTHQDCTWHWTVLYSPKLEQGFPGLTRKPLYFIKCSLYFYPDSSRLLERNL